MSTEAEVPPTWECPECGQLAARRGEDEPEPDEPKKTPRTHWDMLLERRKVDELEVLLNERLEALRSSCTVADRLGAAPGIILLAGAGALVGAGILSRLRPGRKAVAAAGDRRRRR